MHHNSDLSGLFFPTHLESKSTEVSTILAKALRDEKDILCVSIYKRKDFHRVIGMESEGNKFIELIENLRVKQTTLKESILTQEEERQILSEQLKYITECLKLKVHASLHCGKVLKEAEAEYEQFTNMYVKSQKLLANLEKDVMDADAFPLEFDTPGLFPTKITDLTFIESADIDNDNDNQTSYTRRPKRNRTNIDSSTKYTIDDADSATHTPRTKEGGTTVYTADRNQYEVDCILGKCH